MTRALLVICFLAVSGPLYAKPKKSAGQTVTNAQFSFRLPPGFRESKVQGIDSFVAKYVSDGIVLTFDFGSYSNDFRDWGPDTKFELATIDGRKAKIGAGKKGYYNDGENALQAQVHFPSVYQGKMDPKLSMYASCATQEDIETAKTIFKSIRFKRDGL